MSRQDELRKRIKELEAALDYIIDHAWVVKATEGFTDTQKWLNEFVDVAKKARGK